MSTIENNVSVRMGRVVKQQREAAGFSLRMLVRIPTKAATDSNLIAATIPI